MKLRSRPSIHENPHVLTAVAEYRERHLHPREICLRLRISQATYYRCVASLEAIKERAERDD